MGGWWESAKADFCQPAPAWAGSQVSSSGFSLKYVRISSNSRSQTGIFDNFSLFCASPLRGSALKLPKFSSNFSAISAEKLFYFSYNSII